MENSEKRVAALAVDYSFACVLVFVTALIVSFFGSADNLTLLIINRVIGIILIVLVLFAPYFFIKGQTVGKKSQRLKIVKENGDDASVLRLVGRDATKFFLSSITLGLYLIACYIIVMKREDERTPHDFMFGTKVIDLTAKAYKSNKNYDNFVTLKPGDIKEVPVEEKEEENEKNN